MSPLNITNDVTQWFSDLSSRQKMLKSFNDMAKAAYVSGVTHFMFKASITRGKSEYKHQFSNVLFSGLKILAFNNGRFSREDVMVIGLAILANRSLVRRMMLLGWDTLEICCDNSPVKYQWPINDNILIDK